MDLRQEGNSIVGLVAAEDESKKLVVCGELEVVVNKVIDD